VKTENADVQFYSNRRTSKFVKAIVATATTLLLVIPVIVLYLLTIHGASGGLKIGILLLFVVAFASYFINVDKSFKTRDVCGFSGVSPAPDLARQFCWLTSGRYCAVLVVFIGNVPQA